MEPQLTSGLLKEFTTIWIKKDSAKERIFHCVTCTYPLFKYQGTFIMSVPGKATSVLKFPFEIPCRGKSNVWGKCHAVYVIEGFTE